VPSVDEVKMYVSGAVDEVGDAMAALRAAVARLDDAANRLRLVTVGSAHPAVAESLGRLTAARERAEEAADLARAAVDAAEGYRSII
jgi:UDP-N-acetylmuramyl pentapeptide synthase